MHAVVSLLPQPYYARLESIWDDLEQSLGLRGYHFAPYPHFTWQGGQGYDPERLRAVLESLAGQTAPFPVRTNGLGLFTGEQPVIFIPLVKTAELTALHRKIWQALEPAGSGFSSYYHPDNWVPHISLAFLDVTPANIGALMERLAFHSYNWNMQIENFAFLNQPEGEAAKLEYSVPLRG